MFPGPRYLLQLEGRTTASPECGVNCEVAALAFAVAESSMTPLWTLCMIDPEDCMTMAEVRAGVDEIDRQLAALIGQRFRFMDAAARIKPDRSSVRDEARKAQVIANVRENAVVNGWSPERAADLWELLVEASIAYDLVRFDAR